jgi:hypothetical protein
VPYPYCTSSRNDCCRHRSCALGPLLAKPLGLGSVYAESRFTLPWHHALLGHAHALDGQYAAAVPLFEAALERSHEIHLPYLTATAGTRLGETLVSRDPERALDVAETALGVARARAFRAIEVESLRVRASALISFDFRKARFLSAVDHVQLDRLRYQVMLAFDERSPATP